MDNVLQNQELRLSAFGEYLLKQQLVKEGQARYHVQWVRKFLAQRVPWRCCAGSEWRGCSFRPAFSRCLNSILSARMPP